MNYFIIFKAYFFFFLKFTFISVLAKTLTDIIKFWGEEDEDTLFNTFWFNFSDYYLKVLPSIITNIPTYISLRLANLSYVIFGYELTPLITHYLFSRSRGYRYCRLVNACLVCFIPLTVFAGYSAIEYYFAIENTYYALEICNDKYGENNMQKINELIYPEQNKWLTNYSKVPIEFYYDCAKMESESSPAYDYYDWDCHQKLEDKIWVIKQPNPIYKNHIKKSFAEHAPEELKEACANEDKKKGAFIFAIVAIGLLYMVVSCCDSSSSTASKFIEHFLNE